MPPAAGPNDPSDDAPKPRKPKAPAPARKGRRGKGPAGKGPVGKPRPAKPVPAKPVPVKPAAAQPAKPVPAKPTPAKPAPAAGSPGAARGGAPVKDSLIGQMVGRCRIEELIGLGRTARVYRATYEALDQVVAIKILRTEIAENPILVERFMAEAKAIAKVDNENVLKIYDVGMTEGGLYYMVVELLEGEEILDLIQREGSVEPMDAMRIVRQAANGLAAAHDAHGLVHRDIKPQNLFLLEDGTVKVVDFGLATSIDETTERVGTPHYMAPEVCERGAAEPASDVYALGIVLYHLLVGNPPYAGKDIQGILKAHIAGVPLRPERDAPGTPKEVGEIVRALTKRDPLLRPTASEIVDQLDAVGGKELKQKESLGRRRGGGRARSAVARRERAEARKSAPVIALVLGAVIVVGILAAVMSSGGDEPPSQIDTAGTSGTSGSDPIPGTADGGTGTGSAIAAKRAESDAEKAEREAAKARIDEEAEAQATLERAEQWARENWHGPPDTDAVIAKYRYVRSRFEKSKAADEAKRRITLIKRKKLHPHPDREWTSAEALEEAKQNWTLLKPQIEEKIAALDYTAAVGLMPPSISEESGSFARELDFWRTYTTHLVEYRKAAVRAITNAGPDDRLIETPDGEGTVKRLDETEFEVRVGLKTLKYSWAKLGPEAIANLTLDLFGGEADQLILQLAFTYAHELDSFWDAQLELSSTTGVRNHTRMMQIYEKRVRDR